MDYESAQCLTSDLAQAIGKELEGIIEKAFPVKFDDPDKRFVNIFDYNVRRTGEWINTTITTRQFCDAYRTYTFIRLCLQWMESERLARWKWIVNTGDLPLKKDAFVGDLPKGFDDWNYHEFGSKEEAILFIVKEMDKVSDIVLINVFDMTYLTGITE